MLYIVVKVKEQELQRYRKDTIEKFLYFNLIKEEVKGT